MRTNPLLVRQRALEKVVPRFRARPWAWRRADCIVLARALLVALGRKGLPPLPRYNNERGALLALRRQGAASLADLLDGLGLERIAPAAMLPADLAIVPGCDPRTGAPAALDTLVVSVGGKVLGWHEDAPGGLSVIDTDAFLAAWRTI